MFLRRPKRSSTVELESSIDADDMIGSWPFDNEEEIRVNVSGRWTRNVPATYWEPAERAELEDFDVYIVRGPRVLSLLDDLTPRALDRLKEEHGVLSWNLQEDI